MTEPGAEETYRLQIFGHNVEVTTPLEDYVREKVHKVEKLTDNILDVEVRLDVQKLNHSCEVVIKFSHFKVKVHAATTDMYASIDKAFERLQSKMRRWKDRIQDHHARGVSAIEMQVNVLENTMALGDSFEEDIIDENNRSLDDKYFPPKVASQRTRHMKTLTLKEALMKMELSGDNFLIYKSEEEQVLKVLYRREDGSYGIITPTD